MKQETYFVITDVDRGAILALTRNEQSARDFVFQYCDVKVVLDEERLNDDDEHFLYTFIVIKDSSERELLVKEMPIWG